MSEATRHFEIGDVLDMDEGRRLQYRGPSGDPADTSNTGWVWQERGEDGVWSGLAYASGSDLMLAAEIERLRDRSNGFEMESIEGSEILGELKGAIAGLAGEPLRPCDPAVCPGHFGPKANALFKKGLDAWREMHAEAEGGE